MEKKNTIGNPLLFHQHFFSQYQELYLICPGFEVRQLLSSSPINGIIILASPTLTAPYNPFLAGQHL